MGRPAEVSGETRRTQRSLRDPSGALSGLWRERILGGLSLFSLAVIIALAIKPSWQSGVAAGCALATVPVLWVSARRKTAAFRRGETPRERLVGIVPAMVAVVLLGVGFWVISMAPA